jgi:hypothetical protein
MEGILSILFILFGIPAIARIVGVLTGQAEKERKEKEENN